MQINILKIKMVVLQSSCIGQLRLGLTVVDIYIFFWEKAVVDI